MALTDSCFVFIESVGEAAKRFAADAHHYSAPDYPTQYLHSALVINRQFVDRPI